MISTTIHIFIWKKFLKYVLTATHFQIRSLKENYYLAQSVQPGDRLQSSSANEIFL